MQYLYVVVLVLVLVLQPKRECHYCLIVVCDIGSVHHLNCCMVLLPVAHQRAPTAEPETSSEELRRMNQRLNWVDALDRVRLRIYNQRHFMQVHEIGTGSVSPVFGKRAFHLVGFQIPEIDPAVVLRRSGIGKFVRVRVRVQESAVLNCVPDEVYFCVIYTVVFGVASFGTGASPRSPLPVLGRFHDCGFCFQIGPRPYVLTQKGLIVRHEREWWKRLLVLAGTDAAALFIANAARALVMYVVNVHD